MSLERGGYEERYTNLQEAAQLSSVLLVCGIVFGRPVLPEEWRNMQTSEIAGLYSRVG